MALDHIRSQEINKNKLKEIRNIFCERMYEVEFGELSAASGRMAAGGPSSRLCYDVGSHNRITVNSTNNCDNARRIGNGSYMTISYAHCS